MSNETKSLPEMMRPKVAFERAVSDVGINVDPYAQMPMWPTYKAEGGHYRTLLAAAQRIGRVHLKRDHVFRFGGYAWSDDRARAANDVRGCGTMQRPTLFAEITATNMSPHSAADGCIGDIPWANAPGSKRNLAAAAKAGAAALLAHMEESWDHDAVYVIPHSAGYDSRILSALLKKIGADPACTKFVVWEPEVEATRSLFGAIGWPDAALSAIEPGAHDYYGDMLVNFDMIGRVMAEPGRFTAGPLLLAQHAERQGWDNVRGCSAVFSDESMGWNARRLPSVADFLAGFMLDNPGSLAHVGAVGWLAPFASFRWIKVMCEYEVPAAGGSDDLKRAILAELRPDLVDIPNPRYELAKQISRDGHLPHHLISQHTQQEMERLYRESWYGRQPWAAHHKPPSKVTNTDPFLTDYVRAAICEAALNAGVEVIVE